MNAFIDEHRARLGVEPICTALQVAPSAYRRHAARLREPALLPARARRDAQLLPQVQRVFDANLRVYGADKVWRQLLREDVTVARCTVERLMRRLGLQGARRGKGVRTTVPDAKAACPLDRVNRHFKAERPNQLWVADFTYVSTWQGFVYVAFVVDVFARRIVGWRVSIRGALCPGATQVYSCVRPGSLSKAKSSGFRTTCHARVFRQSVQLHFAVPLLRSNAAE